ncbi:hypothetical protein PVAND_011376 [Polypedilum vanderplanki]|uniref:Regulatory protein zeste n=1 Tax=Polypedilum vanderplanki TaxID=319348 RepID=A0A9J6CID4_POLVA|nr:hypothetical protein PVAND_011376 [Polypedilum vanderplanki]
MTTHKRNRSDNFEPDDIELLVSLLSEHTDIDSPKLDAKKQAWDTIAAKFNINCTGIKRDINSLKMKVKNMKAQSNKRPKMEVIEDDKDNTSDINESKHGDNNEEDHNNETDANQSHSEQNSSKPARKRCKKFSKTECDLLLNLYEKHCQGLDSSCSASSIKRRSEAWKLLTEDFNKQQTTNIRRDENELKIKIKNIKAMKVKSEPSMENIKQSNSPTSVSLTPIKVVEVKKSIHPSNVVSSKIDNYSNIDIVTTEALYEDEDDYEEEYIQPMPMQRNDEDKELERVRRENILLKNAVLKKKERLLELQIALAERNLRRQI